MIPIINGLFWHFPRDDLCDSVQDNLRLTVPKFIRLRSDYNIRPLSEPAAWLGGLVIRQNSNVPIGYQLPWAIAHPVKIGKAVER